MDVKITRTSSTVTKLNIAPLKELQKKYEKLEKVLFLEAAQELQRRVVLAMALVYKKTKKNRKYYHKDYLERTNDVKIEHHLFAGDVSAFISNMNKEGARLPGEYQVRPNGKGKYEVSVFPNRETREGMYEILPHLRWQESRTKANIDAQPYLDPSKLKKGERLLYTEEPNLAITKEAAKSIPKRKIRIIQVHHKSSKNRGFILAATRLLKSQGNTIVHEFLVRRLAEEGGKKKNA